MNPEFIDADDRHRAADASVRSPEFRRMVQLVWPHRRFIVIGLIASVIYGALNSISIVGVLPVLKVMLSPEGFHGWVYRAAAEDRLDVHFGAAGAVGTSEPWVKVFRIGRRSPLAEHEVRAGDEIGSGDVDADSSLRFLEMIAGAEGDVELLVRSPGQADTEPSAGRRVTVRLAPASWKVKVLDSAGRAMPAERTYDDRVYTLAYVLGCVAVLVLLSNIARFVAHYVTSVGVLRGVMDLRRRLYSKVLRLPMSFFAQDVSDVVSRFVQDVQEVQRGLVSLFGKLLREPLRAVFLLLVALFLNAKLTLVMLLVGPVVVVVFWAVGRKIRKANRRLLRSYGVMIGALGTTLQAIDVVKAYNAEHTERKRLWRIDRKMLRDQLKIAWLEGVLNPMLEVMGVLAVSAVTVWLGAQVIDQQIEIAEFVALVVALGMLTDPLRKVADVYPRVMRSAAGAQRIFSVIDAPAERELLQGAIELEPPARAIELKGVTFTYPGGPEPALNDVNLTISIGETVALVGPNGSGKTTLARMLVRFYDPQQGQVLFDDTDIRQATLRSLRKQLSVVSQDPVVFAMTVAENIAYGTRHADRAAVERAAERAHADDFIREKADGFDEQVGERGGTLSGGQRQRLCIARAVLRGAPILIFDEATSQIDSESERKIQQSLAELSRGRTTLIIAHRLSTIRYASRIVVMDKGRVTDMGTHDELLKRCELYKVLCETQLAG
jgi:subfamily B ATP-binding cassette protein MsbA